MFVVFGSILSMLENKFAVGATLPKVQKRTMVDFYVDVSYLCVFISSASAFVVRFVAQEMDMSRAWTANYILFGFNCFLWLATVVYVVYKVTRVEEDIGDWLRHAQAQRQLQSASGRDAVDNVAVQRGLSRKIRAKARRGSSVLDVGGGRKAGKTPKNGNARNKLRIHKAVYDVKVITRIIHAGCV
jgi:hypothetical protein